jgi:hypothetical protein
MGCSQAFRAAQQVDGTLLVSIQMTAALQLNQLNQNIN